MQIETGAQPARRVLEGLLAQGASRFGSRVAASSAAGRLSFDKLRHDADEVRRRLRGRDDGAAVAAVKLDGSTHDLAAIRPPWAKLLLRRRPEQLFSKEGGKASYDALSKTGAELDRRADRLRFRFEGDQLVDSFEGVIDSSNSIFLALGAINNEDFEAADQEHVKQKILFLSFSLIASNGDCHSSRKPFSSSWPWAGGARDRLYRCRDLGWNTDEAAEDSLLLGGWLEISDASLCGCASVSLFTTSPRAVGRRGESR